jgi:hypothetical protein
MGSHDPLRRFGPEGSDLIVEIATDRAEIAA